MKIISVCAILMLLAVCPVYAQTTYDLLASEDDTTGITGVGTDVNNIANASVIFGRFESVGVDYDYISYYRYVLDIPRASKITSSKLYYTCNFSTDGGFGTTVGLGVSSGSPAWKNSDGLHTDNYADASALNAISLELFPVAWDPIETWTITNNYDSPSLLLSIQYSVNVPDYDPGDAADKYVLLVVDDGDGDYLTTSANADYRYSHSYDGDNTKDPQLIVDYDPWGEVMVSGGYKVNPTGGFLQYYGY